MSNDRVLNRRGAHLLTQEEAERVGGGFDTAPCMLTGGGHGTATDIFCPDCPSC